MGLRVIDVQNNRGDGGQNEIGPELFRDIAVLRTSELLSAHRIDGAEQYFTRAIDYGYSFDPEEVIGKWGRKEIVGDYVRLMRTLRPDVVVTMNIQGRGGDRAHEATTVLVREAYRAAGDPSMYPEQIAGRVAALAAEEAVLRGRAGRSGPAVPAPGAAPAAVGAAAVDVEAVDAPPRLPHRHALRGGCTRSADGPKLTPVNTGMYDPLLGPHLRRNRHRRPQQSQVPGRRRPGPRRSRIWRRCGGAVDRAAAAAIPLMDTTLTGQMGKEESSLFDGIDTSLTAHRAVCRSQSARGPDRRPGQHPRRRQARAERSLPTATMRPPPLRSKPVSRPSAPCARSSPAMGLSDSARYEIDFRLKHQGARLSRMPCSRPTTSPSTPSPTMAW